MMKTKRMSNRERELKAIAYLRESLRMANNINEWNKIEYAAKSRRKQNDFYKKCITFSIKNAITLLERKRGKR